MASKGANVIHHGHRQGPRHLTVRTSLHSQHRANDVFRDTSKCIQETRRGKTTEEVAKNMSAWQQPKLRNSLRKYGYEAHKIETVLQCSVHDLDTDGIPSSGARCLITKNKTTRINTNSPFLAMECFTSMSTPGEIAKLKNKSGGASLVSGLTRMVLGKERPKPPQSRSWT